MRLLLRYPCLCACSLHLNRYAAIYRSFISIFGIFVLVLICLAGVFIASFLAIARPMCKVRHVVQDVHAVLVCQRQAALGPATCTAYSACDLAPSQHRCHMHSQQHALLGMPARHWPHKSTCWCQAIEKSAEAMERAAQATETSAQEVEKAAIMLQMDAPSLLDSLEASIQVQLLLMLITTATSEPEGHLCEIVMGYTWAG